MNMFRIQLQVSFADIFMHGDSVTRFNVWEARVLDHKKVNFYCSITSPFTHPKLK